MLCNNNMSRIVDKAQIMLSCLRGEIIAVLNLSHGKQDLQVWNGSDSQ